MNPAVVTSIWYAAAKRATDIQHPEDLFGLLERLGDPNDGAAQEVLTGVLDAWSLAEPGLERVVRPVLVENRIEILRQAAVMIRGGNPI